MPDSEVARNIASLQTKIRLACQAAGRTPDSVTLIAVGKTFAAEKIRAAVAAGVHNIAENYIQESVNKIPHLSDLPIIFHFIGRLQKNKSRDAAHHFHWVHTVDNSALMRRLAAFRKGMPPLQICLQVNIDREKSKSGAMPEEVPALAREALRLPELHLRGLMAIPRPRDKDRRAPYKAMAMLRDDIQQKCGAPLDSLSMGMSNDFADAIAEGATHIRIGRAIFGAR